MAKKRLVREARDHTFAFTCPYPSGCGYEADDGHVPWVTDNWPNYDLAAARGKQHLREHETGADPTVDTEVTPPLADFYVEHGLVDENAVTPPNPDDWEV
jgi:hypothetical protein